MAVIQSSSGGVAIRYVLPVLWMTSCLQGHCSSEAMDIAPTPASGINCVVQLSMLSERATKYWRGVWEVKNNRGGGGGLGHSAPPAFSSL